MNEAEISGKIVQPLLETLGMDYQNLKLENSFTIKTGRYSSETFTWKNKLNFPRFDILATVDGKNLFIIEVKKDEITPDDVEQGRLYAKLVSPPAPFVILTNGSTSRIFETFEDGEFTGELSNSKYAQNNFKIDLDDETRELALYALFTLNYENFLNFCKKQNENTLSLLKLNITSKNVGKYIPEIFVNRQQVNRHFYDFLDNNDTCFLISGKSGIGKTTSMCNLAEEINQSNPVLFYNASQLSEKLEKEIGSDLNWEFSTNKSHERLFNQLDQICKRHATKLIIFVDAIDEWWSETSTVDISKFVEHIKNKDIKLVLSCKNTEIDNFLSIMGNPSTLSQYLHISDKKQMKKFVSIENFNHGELIEAVRKYTQFFNLSGLTTTSETGTACKDPFLLRVISEIYCGKEVPSKLNSTQIYEKYLNMLSEKKSNNLPSLSSILVEICKIMFSSKTNDLYENQIQNLNEYLFTFLINYGIIRQQKDKLGRSKFSFSFDPLRNYLISFHLLQIDKLNILDLEKFIDKISTTKIGLELIKWYKDIAPENHFKILKQKVMELDKKLAEEFLSRFVNKVNTDFPFIRNRLFPDCELGLLVLYDKENNFVYEYGYRCCNPGEDQVIWIDDKKLFWGEEKSYPLMEKYGVSRLTYNSRDFSNISLSDFVHKQIVSITKEIVENRLLDESNNINISLEKFFTSFRSWSDLLGYSRINYDTEFTILPLEIEPLLKIIEQRFSKLVPYYYLDKPKENTMTTLHEALQNLSYDIKKIERTALQYCDDPDYASRYIKPSPEYFTKDGLKKYLVDFMEKFIQEYRNLVETNFPTLKNEFPLYQKYPYYVIMRLSKTNNEEKANGLKYVILKNENGENEIEARNYDEDKIKINYEISPWEVTTKKGIMKTNTWTNTTLFSLFLPTNSVLDDCILTGFVYKQIENDLKEIFGSNFT